MLDWFSRYGQRQRDLAAGVDADLVQSNRKKSTIALLLSGAGFFLIGIDHFAKLHGLIHEVFVWLFGLLVFGGLFVGKWAQQERAFLGKSDPRKPPSLFK